MMTRGRRRSFLDRFLEQEKTPVCSALAALTTILVWSIVFFDLLHRPHDWGGLAQGFLLVAVLFLGLIANSIVGVLAARRGEYWGGRIAALGAALWLLTVLVFVRVRGNRLWP
jgi:hypothetical protein